MTALTDSPTPEPPSSEAVAGASAERAAAPRGAPDGVEAAPPRSHDVLSIVRGVVAVSLGVFAVGASVVRYHNQTGPRADSALPLYLALTATAAGLAIALVRRRSLPLGFVGTALTLLAVVLTGLPELPTWASVDAFGFSPHYLWVVLALLAVGVPFAAGTHERRSGDASLMIFVMASAFSGPFYVRDPAEYFPLLVLAGSATALSADAGSRRTLWQVPFALAFTALLAWTFLPLVLPEDLRAEDLHRHVEGWSRLLVAGVPLLVLGLGPMDTGRARAIAKAFALMAGLGGVCAAIAVLEAGWFFSLKHALGTRLRLFGQDPNIIAPYFAVAPPIVLAILISTRRLLGRIALGATLALVLVAAALTGSKTSIGATALGIGLFVALAWAATVWRTAPHLRRRLAVVTLALFALGGAGAFVAKDRVTAKFTSDPSIQFRMYLWDTARKAIAERPMFGYGLQVREPLMVFAETSDLDGRPKDTHPHQIFLNMAMGAGVPAAILLGLLIVWFALRMTIAAASLEATADRLLAASLVGSGLALLLANMLDQGLALNTPFPLHVGMLLGIGSLLVLKSRPTRRPAPFLVRAPITAVVTALAAGVVAFNVAAVVSERLRDSTDRALAENRLDDADRLSIQTAALNPWSLHWGLRRAAILERLGRVDEAIELCWALTREHPLSWEPWDRISTAQFNRGTLVPAMNAAEEARALDPTGKRASAWLLRRAIVLLHTGRVEQAQEAMAESFRYDYATPTGLSWAKDERGEWYYDAKGKAPRVYLRPILMRNRRLIPQLCRDDWVLARRVATTLAKIGEAYYIFDLAKEAIADFKQHSPHPWMALHIIQEQIEETERRLKEREGEPIDARERTFKETAFEGEKGEAAIYLARGDNFYQNGEPQRALMAYKQGVEALYDMYSEKHYAKDLIKGVFLSALRGGDLAEARRWLPPTLYFHRTALDRIDLLVELAWNESRGGDPLRAIDSMERASGYIDKLTPAQAKDALQNMAAVLEPLLKLDGEGRLRALSLLEAQKAASPQGRALFAFVLRVQGNFDGFRREFEALEEADAAWAFDLESQVPSADGDK